MFSFHIALDVGQRVHRAQRRTLRARWGLVPLLPNRGLGVQKVFTQKIVFPVPKGDEL